MGSWDLDSPIERSAYLNTDSEKWIIPDSFSVNKNTVKHLDLFCGAGGFSVGCELAGIDTVCGIDYFEPAMNTYIHNHKNTIGILGDIKKLDEKSVRNKLKELGVDKIHLITGGIPCQGFSLASRKHRDDDSRNFLYLHFFRFVREFNPDFVIIENVSGIRSAADGYFEAEICKNLQDIGYSVSIKLVNAADYGVPQNRRRVIFVGSRFDTYVFPKGSFELNHRTVYDAISDLPELGNNQSCCEYTKEPITEYQNIMRGNGYLNIEKPLKLFNHTSAKHPDKTIDRIKNTKPGYPMYDSFKQRIRLSWHTSSPTQLAGGIRPQFQFGHPDQPRGLTIRERARIQSFPDCFEFLGGITQERVQTGNAVPPLLIYELLLPIINNYTSLNKIYSNIVKDHNDNEHANINRKLF